MILGFTKLIEERIIKAQKEGAFDKLEGTGKPLVFHDDSMVPEDLKLAYKILKNAGFCPPEIEIKKEIKKVEDLLKNEKDEKEKYQTLKGLNFLIMKLNQMRGKSFEFDIPQEYNFKLVDRLSKNNKPLARKDTP